MTTARRKEIPMRVTAAVLYDVNKPYAIEAVELDPPKRGRDLPERSPLPEGRGDDPAAGRPRPRGLRHRAGRGRGRDDGQARRPGDPQLRPELRALLLLRERAAA